MIEFIFYMVAFTALIVVFRENKDCNKHNKKLDTEIEHLHGENTHLIHQFHNIVTKNIELKNDIMNLKKFESENYNLKLLLKKIKSSYLTKSSKGHGEIDDILKEEYGLLKDEEGLVKEEELLLVRDNKLLIEEEELLKKQAVNYKSQIDELRDANHNIHKYIDTINMLNHKTEEIMDKNIELTQEITRLKRV